MKHMRAFERSRVRMDTKERSGVQFAMSSQQSAKCGHSIFEIRNSKFEIDPRSTVGGPWSEPDTERSNVRRFESSAFRRHWVEIDIRHSKFGIGRSIARLFKSVLGALARENFGLGLAVRLWQQIPDENLCGGSCEGSDGLRCANYSGGLVGPAERSTWRGMWVAIHLEDAVRKVHNPVFRNSGASVSRRFVGAVVEQCGIGYFHEKNCCGWVGIAIFAQATWDHRNVRFGLGFIVEGEGALGAKVVASGEEGAECGFHEADCRCMRTALGGHGEDFSVEEFYVIVWGEDTGLDHVVVFLASPAAQE